MVGYVHGATLPADKPWWISPGTRRPTQLQTLADVRQVFWLRELMVLPEYQNQGLGRKIHDAVISGRAESATTLTCIIDNQPAHDAYLRWGYTVMSRSCTPQSHRSTTPCICLTARFGMTFEGVGGR
ncbi:GNAT family N-acetyltransferase [Streptomyces anulatus]|uniref:GNAT family N-acetyltransferase n=1 Tax=Streptomyces anulatus TaxID=1892 RepID=UPI0036B4D5EE